MEPYIHKVQYYETDMMGITHHANYIRWMEEARIEYLSQIGFSYAEVEKMGIIIPVVSVGGRYRHPTTFSDVISIEVAVTEFSGARVKLSYLMKNADGKTVFEGTSEHAFLTREGRPVRMKKEYPELFAALNDLLEKEE